MRSVARPQHGWTAVLSAALILTPRPGAGAEVQSPAAPSPPSLTVEQITARMAEMDAQRTAALRHYTSLRRYRVENQRFHRQAEMLVRITYTQPGRKEFAVLSESGSSVVRNRVLRRMLESESGASRHDTQITPRNYHLSLIGAEQAEGRECYVIEAVPRTKHPLLFRGRIWVDARDFAIVRIQGSPAKNPSFWIRKTEFMHRYQNIGPFWLAASNHSRTDVRIFGTTEVTVEFYDYRVNQPESAPGVNTGAKAGH